MEAVIAANLDNPQINGMRLALAERYYEAGDYRSAFPHFLAVAESEGATDTEAGGRPHPSRLDGLRGERGGRDRTSSSRSGLGNRTRIPGRPLSQGKGPVVRRRRRHCRGLLFEEVLENQDLPEESRAEIESALESAGSGEACI